MLTISCSNHSGTWPRLSKIKRWRPKSREGSTSTQKSSPRKMLRSHCPQWSNQARTNSGSRHCLRPHSWSFRTRKSSLSKLITHRPSRRHCWLRIAACYPGTIQPLTYPLTNGTPWERSFSSDRSRSSSLWRRKQAVLTENSVSKRPRR